jgi:peptide/nickel transport system substrate-binding protein
MSGRLSIGIAVAAIAAGAIVTMPAYAQTPKKGGILNFAVVAEPPNLDCHAVTTFAFLHPASPHYSTLLKYAGGNENLRIVGDLAQTHDVSEDGLTYTFKLRQGVKFHDGSPLGSADVKATYERIVDPPQGVVSARKALFTDIGSIETPNDHTVVFKMKAPNSSALINFASPFNCIYSAAKLKQNPRYPETEVMGTGAFQFVEYVKGSHWSAKRFEGYFDKDRPYLDGYKAFFVKSANVVPGMAGGQFLGEFRGRTPAERDQLVEKMKDSVVNYEGPWVASLMLTFNTRKKPFDDLRVRQALTMAIDRWGGSQALSKISLLKQVSGLLRPGYELALPPAELEKLPGYARDIDKSRAAAKQLLNEAGHQALKVKFVNRNIAEPYTPAGVYVVDQWRRIGVEADHTQLETKLYFDAQKNGDFDVTVDFIADFADDPSAQFVKALTSAKSPVAFSGHSDTKLDELFEKQQRATSLAERRKYVHEFERHTLTQAYIAPILWWQRIVSLHKSIKGWEMMPSHFVGQGLVDVWIDQ